MKTIYLIPTEVMSKIRPLSCNGIRATGSQNPYHVSVADLTPYHVSLMCKLIGRSTHMRDVICLQQRHFGVKSSVF